MLILQEDSTKSGNFSDIFELIFNQDYSLDDKTPDHHFTNSNLEQTLYNILKLNKARLYEAVVISRWPHHRSFINSAAMGIRFNDDNFLLLNPYPETDTYKILLQVLEDGLMDHVISINFTYNPLTFAKTALFGCNEGIKTEELKGPELLFKDNIPVLEEASLILLCKPINRVFDINDPEQNRPFEYDFKGHFKKFDGKIVKKRFSARFELKIDGIYRKRNVGCYINRGDYLAIEAVVLASKLPVYFNNNNNKKPINKTNNPAYGTKKLDNGMKLLERIRLYQKEIRRFSGNIRAFETCEIIDNFIDKLFSLD